MAVIRSAAPWMLLASWILFSGLLAVNHMRVRRERKRQGIPEEKPSIRDARSMRGLVIEGISFLIAFLFYRTPAEAADWQCAGSIAAGMLSVGMVAAALRHLNLEWRIKAVVTEDHRLVTTGPYGVVRHPVFFALFCLLVAQTLLATQPVAAVVAWVVCVYGTQIRIVAEDGLLSQRFGARFDEYRARVHAWWPVPKKPLYRP